MSEVPTVQQGGGTVVDELDPVEVQPAGGAHFGWRRSSAAATTGGESRPFADRVERVRDLMSRRASVGGSPRS